MAVELSKRTWISVLSQVFEMKIDGHLDSIDLNLEALNNVLVGIDEKKLRALEFVYCSEFSTLGIAGKMMARYAHRKVPYYPERMRQLSRHAVRILKHPSRQRRILAAIGSSWNLHAR